jgi:acetoacetyl-CoA synthetase
LWAGIWDYFDSHSPTPYEQVMSDALPATPRFFGAQVGYVEHLFLDKDPGAIAIIDVQEPSTPHDPHIVRTMTWSDLHAQVTTLARRFATSGLPR